MKSKFAPPFVDTILNAVAPNYINCSVLRMRRKKDNSGRPFLPELAVEKEENADKKVKWPDPKDPLQA